jgi:hypothetical protein
LGDGEILIGDASGDPATLDVGSSTAITIVGALASGSISSGFGAIDVGSSSIDGGTITGTFSGNITGNVTGNVSGSAGSATGNAATATALATARAINGTDFDGTAAITVTAAAGTLTGATLASGVTASSLTSVGTLTSLATSGDITLNTTQKVHLDGGSGTYIAETSGNVIGIVADNTEALQVKTTGIVIPAGTKIALDGDNGTYIAETAGNVIGIVADNNETLRVGVSGIGIKTAPNATYALDSAGAVRLTGLPTSDPSVAGALYIVSGDLRIST